MFGRWLYTLTMYLLTPVIVYRLALRGLRYREYFARWRERFGFFDAPDLDGSIWVHAVSVGEVNAAVPLIHALMRRYAGRPFVITTVTPTGSARVVKLFGDQVIHVYLPYDLPASVRRFLDRVKPRVAVVMETEIWPNLFLICDDRDIPVVVANARLSQRSLDGYGPVRPLARRAIRSARAVAAQSKPDAERLLALGALPERLSIAGNVKFDMGVPGGLGAAADLLRDYWGKARPVWIAASTHEGEEAAMIEAHTQVLHRYPDALLLLAPRHPERFRPVVQLCRQYGFRTRVRSEDTVALAETEVFVIDTLGELLTFYAACDVAFVAGSFDPIGGHNVLEPAALGRPVIVGPHTFNFAEITETMLDAGAAVRVNGATALGDAVVRLFNQPALRDTMGRAGLDVVARERGAVDRVMRIVASVVDEDPWFRDDGPAPTPARAAA
jgi:3-deoxy-D-manno-octulosonic-acid transferase